MTFGRLLSGFVLWFQKTVKLEPPNSAPEPLIIIIWNCIVIIITVDLLQVIQNVPKIYHYI